MKKSAIIGLIVIAVSIGVIVSVYADSSTYANFTDAKKSDSELHVTGTLDLSKAMEYDPQKDANYFAFHMKDKEGVDCKVIFYGTKPQDFERSENIVLTGKMVGDEFHANKMLLKCPSKYNKDEVEVKAAPQQS